MVSVGVHVPDSFGKVNVAALDVVDAQGKKVASVSLAPAIPTTGKISFECDLGREYLKNSTLGLAHDAKETLDCAIIHLGTFEVRDFKPMRPPSPPKIWLALAEQGIPGEPDGDFTLTDKVPLVEGQVFGFRMYLRGDGRTFPVRVEQTLPSPPKSWGEPEAVKRLKISEDGRTASETMMVPGDKLFEQGWTIADGDPEGDYLCKVFVRDELVKTFTFHVHEESAKPEGDTRQPQPTP